MPEPEPEADEGRSFAVGDVVHDRDAEPQNAAYVTTLPDATAEEWIAHNETTVAEDNPEYPADAPVVVVVYGKIVDFELPEWDRYTPLSVSEIEEAGAPYYSFPAPRLIRDHERPNAPDTESTESGVTESAPDTGAPEETEEPAGQGGRVRIDDLGERLGGAGWTVSYDTDVLTVEKGDESYRIHATGEIEGDGQFRPPVETLVGDYTDPSS